jgi:hypothetical protein
MPRILCLTTGGTIAAARDAAGLVATSLPGGTVVGAAVDDPGALGSIFP